MLHHIWSCFKAQLYNCIIVPKVLGTFIVEYDEGKVKAERFLKDDKIAAILVKKLVDLAVYFRFDGWLLNFEVELDYSLIPTLVNFCKSLTEEMHKAMPDSLVIWWVLDDCGAYGLFHIAIPKPLQCSLNMPALPFQ